MEIQATKRFLKSYSRLSVKIKTKVKKALTFLKSDLSHPSLRVKKVQGEDSLWEARVDLFYRMIFTKRKNEAGDGVILLEDVGPHDEGHGKK